jgi:signal recognition particle GTPase
MSLVVDLDPKTEEALKKKAAVKGTAVDTYVKALIEQDVAFQAIEQRLEPVRQQFEESKMTEDELDEFMFGVLAKVRAEKRVE